MYTCIGGGVKEQCTHKENVLKVRSLTIQHVHYRRIVSIEARFLSPRCS